MIESMEISPRYNARNWTSLTFSAEEDWQKAVDIFEDRIRGRFLDIIACIESHAYAGFAVLALDCLLIETLQQFREGKHETPSGQAKQYFVRFLTQTSFGDFFSEETAVMFYKQFRCGILHQAEVKATSLVRRRQVPLVDFTDDRQGLIINRELFHRQLVIEFEHYVGQLRENNPLSKVMRQNFRKKMDYICRVPSEIE